MCEISPKHGETGMTGSVVFVFGSNLAGIHGSGAARDALQFWGAKLGCGVGLQGESYAIPTKDKNIETLRLSEIAGHVRFFINFAWLHPEIDFQVTRIGCGLAGYNDRQIAPMFVGAPSNCHLPLGWRKLACPHLRQVTPEGQYTTFRCLDCGIVGEVDNAI